jgi:putative PIG3 family NAD(P)H quinone oxidoreductase
MRAVVVTKPGGPEVLQVREVPQPTPPPMHVRVRIAFAGVNRADLLQRMGMYPAPPGAPADVPGLEYAGVVDAVGEGVTRHRVGDRVFGLVGGGAYGENVVVHERETVATPSSITDEQAAAIPESFVTAYDALVVRGRLQPGERVLISAAGSGVGTAGVQIARALGCTVIGTSRTQDKLDRARSLGLDVAIVPDKGSFADRVLAETNGAGVDVVMELVGGPYMEENLRACAPRGRIVVVGLTAGATSEINLGLVLRKRLEIVGTALRSRPIEEKIEAARILERTIAPWLAREIVKPVIDRVFPLAEAGASHTHVASDATFGKVLLAV